MPHNLLETRAKIHKAIAFMAFSRLSDFIRYLARKRRGASRLSCGLRLELNSPCKNPNKQGVKLWVVVGSVATIVLPEAKRRDYLREALGIDVVVFRSCPQANFVQDN